MTAPPGASERLVVFSLDKQRYALPLEAVERIVHAVEIVPLPAAPPVVLGLIDLRGCVIPVISLRRRLSLPDRDLALTDQLVVARTERRTVALPVDETNDVIAADSGRVVRGGAIPGAVQFEGVVRLDDGLALIHDLTRLLSLEEEQALDAAMDARARALDG